MGRENLYTFEMATILAVSTLQRRVIRGWNGNFVGFLGIFSKIVKNISMKRYLHFSGKRRIWPTRIWNLTSKFEAIWGQYGLKPLLFVYFNSNICSNCIFSTQIYQYIVNWLYLSFLPLARKIQIQHYKKIFHNFWKYSRKTNKFSVPSSYYTAL